MEEQTPLQKIVNLFNDYFGEERVDLQGHTILVYYPTVKVTNENDRSVDLTELYVKVKIQDDGTLVGTFSINRSEYTAAQWFSNYCHSHVREIKKVPPYEFQNPCLGEGPIKNTCASLNADFDEDIWKLFIFELDKYIHTESLSGGPYRKLENIGIDISNRSVESQIIVYQYSNELFEGCGARRLITEFFPYIIDKRLLSFNYIDGKYGIAEHPVRTIIRVSNLFIEWYNNLPILARGNLINDLFIERLLIKCKIDGYRIFTRVRSSNGINQVDLLELNRYIGTPLWRFKGKQVLRNITDIPNLNDNEDPLMAEFLRNASLLLRPDIVMFLVNKILKIVNVKYGKNDSSFDKEILYL